MSCGDGGKVEEFYVGFGILKGKGCICVNGFECFGIGGCLYGMLKFVGVVGCYCVFEYLRLVDGFVFEVVDKDDVCWCVIDLYNV